MLRVLLITREPWRDDSNEGSVLSSWFEDQPMELAHIYCKPGNPENRCCRKYFQLTDKMAAKNLLRGEEMGAVIEFSDSTGEEAAQKASEKEKKAFYDFFRRNNWASFFLARECLWGLAKWKSKALEAFVDDFAPDVIVAPLCYSSYVMRIQRWVAKRLNKPMVGIVWDDIYSFKQWHFSPIYWLNRMLHRRGAKKTADACAALYTLCPQQAEGFKQQFHQEFGVFPKVGTSSVENAETDDTCVRFIYAGGIYFGRMRTLDRIAKTIAELNEQGVPCRLDVYTNSPDAKSLEAYGACEVHAAVQAEQLRKLYRASHVALHAEGFRRSDMLQFRLSFSSKIVDCLSSGCAVLAICPECNCGYQYLKAENAAVCVDQWDELPAGLLLLAKDKQQRELWAQRARACVKANHSQEYVRMLIYQQMMKIAGIEADSE